MICPDVPDDGLVIHQCHTVEDVAGVRAGVTEHLRNRIYPLGEAPMYDLVITMGPDDTVVHLSVDLLIADFVSISILMTDFQQCLLDPECDLAPVDFSFRDYLLNLARERSSAAGSARRERDLAYWRDRLDQLPSPLSLPVLPDD